MIDVAARKQAVGDIMVALACMAVGGGLSLVGTVKGREGMLRWRMAGGQVPVTVPPIPRAFSLCARGDGEWKEEKLR